MDGRRAWKYGNHFGNLEVEGRHIYADQKEIRCDNGLAWIYMVHIRVQYRTSLNAVKQLRFR
jgi:hypothetical protein